MSATAERPLRIGEVAELTGTTPRTIRYYEEIGLLPGASDRAQGKHRFYTAGRRRAGAARSSACATCSGLSLEQLSQLLEAETARAELRREYQQTEDPAAQQADPRALARPHRRPARARPRPSPELEQLEKELCERKRLVQRRLKEVSS